jgi:hypothetical protein
MQQDQTIILYKILSKISYLREVLTPALDITKLKQKAI